jgi:hypothetical protein
VRVRAKIRGRRAYSLRLGKKIPAAAGVVIGRELQTTLRNIIGGIRTRQGEYFDNPSGRLARTMYAKFRRLPDRGYSGQVLWGVPYGHRLEWAWKKRKLTIKPKRGTHLRFVYNGRVVYRRQVVQYDSPARRRKHATPELEREWPKFKVRVRKSVGEVISRG